MNVLNTIPTWLPNQGERGVLPNAPAWLLDYRQQQWQAFMAQGMPTRKDERWKYTDLSFLATKNFTTSQPFAIDEISDAIQQHRLQSGNSILLVTVNGKFKSELSDLNKLPSGMLVCNIAQAWQLHAELVKANWLEAVDAKAYPFASMNLAMFDDGLFISVPDACEVEMPVHVLSLVVGAEQFIAQPQNMIVLGQNSKLTLVEEYFSFVPQTYMMNVMTNIVVGKNATLSNCKIQNEGTQAVHMANTFIRQLQNSNVTITQFTKGAIFARDDVMVQMLEPGASCHTGGFYRLYRDNQYVDYHIDINHCAPLSNSAMLYKGILDNKSRSVFNGRLHIKKDAQKIVAYQANHNLLLSPYAEVYSKPELEIYADDVKCKHGATTGQIDQDALFYMRSRGIPHAEAMTILLEGFADEVLQTITHVGIKKRVQETMY